MKSFKFAARFFESLNQNTGHQIGSNTYFLIVGVVLLLVLAVFQFQIIVHVNNVTVGPDEWLIMPEVAAAYRGEFNFAEYWRPHGGHHWLGYKLLFVGNALFFGLDLRILQFTGAILWLFACFVTCFFFTKKLNCGPYWLQTIAVACIVLSFLTPHAWHLQTYALTSMRLGNIFGFILVFVTIDQLIFVKNKVYKPYLFLALSFLLLMFTLVFGRGWGQAMLVSSFA